MNELLMRVADGHEGINLIISWHENFPYLGKSHSEALVL